MTGQTCACGALQTDEARNAWDSARQEWVCPDCVLEQHPGRLAAHQASLVPPCEAAVPGPAGRPFFDPCAGQLHDVDEPCTAEDGWTSGTGSPRPRALYVSAAPGGMLERLFGADPG